MLHFMNMSLDGIVGLSPIQLCKNAFGLGLAAEKFGAQFFGNAARASGVLSHPAHLDTESYENLKKSVHEWANGDTALRPIILEEGMRWEQITINPNDAQFLETRKFQKEEIAGLYRVPLHLLQDLQRATNNNIEHQGLDYVRFCLSPRAVNIEQEINFKLLGKGYICEHNFMDLQRGDFPPQTTGLLALRNGGVYSANDVLISFDRIPFRTRKAATSNRARCNGSVGKPDGYGGRRTTRRPRDRYQSRRRQPGCVSTTTNRSFLSTALP